MSATLVISAFYPGYMSFDSAYQYWQVRTGQITTQHPPLMVFIWILTDQIVQGPGGLFLLHVVLYWLALSIISLSISDRSVWRVFFVLVVGFWPYNLLLLPHLWKDVGVLVSFLMSIACLLQHGRSRTIWWLWISLGFTIYASLLRHNAFPAALPIFWYCAVEMTTTIKSKISVQAYQKIVAGVIISLFVLTGTIGSLLNSLPPVSRQVVWPTLVLWDLAWISVKVDKFLMPDFSVAPGMTTSELRAVLKPWTNTTLFQRRVYNGLDTAPYTRAQYRELLLTWLQAIWDHPRAYFLHRWQVTKALYRLSPYPEQQHMDFSHGIVHYKDNPIFEANNGPLNRYVVSYLEGTTRCWLFDGWLYLLGSVGVLTLALKYRSQYAERFVIICMSSGLLYSLAMPLIAPSTDGRFHAWLVMSVMVGSALALKIILGRWKIG